ncbi:hypothetical protein P3X46_032873 [Hevea brasiliensis]|uniref:EF-hand domain-containing protein n=1 Tax=Hevea brasiliensis TaxID=3981 RepID=A0ABQ9KFW4_HEVBR|nr:hypothetical protein P3X46_032873 [Hevea brasiliensis]
MGFKALFHLKKSKKSEYSSVDSITAPLTGLRFFLQTKSQLEELEQVFKKFNVNGDGKISSSELGSIMSSLGHQANKEELHKMITEFDADGDGFIDFQEFTELNTQGVDTDELHKVMGSLGEPYSIAECRKMISGVDSDGDGMMTVGVSCDSSNGLDESKVVATALEVVLRCVSFLMS